MFQPEHPSPEPNSQTQFTQIPTGIPMKTLCQKGGKMDIPLGHSNYYNQSQGILVGQGYTCI